MGGIKGPRCNRYSRVARSCLHILHRIRLGRSAEAFCAVEVPTVSSPALKGNSSGELGNIAICKGDPSLSWIFSTSIAWVRVKYAPRIFCTVPWEWWNRSSWREKFGFGLPGLKTHQVSISDHGLWKKRTARMVFVPRSYSTPPPE
jgi:hypothetical protein